MFKPFAYGAMLGLLLVACSPAPETPSIGLHDAVVSDNLTVIQQHIDAGANLNLTEPSGGSTPLTTAAVLGKTAAAKLLISGGADLNAQNNEGSTALMTAAFMGNIEIVQALLDAGADKTIPDNKGATPLMAVEAPFQAVKPVYDHLATALAPIGLVVDYAKIEAARPKIAELLR